MTKADMTRGEQGGIGPRVMKRRTARRRAASFIP